MSDERDERQDEEASGNAESAKAPTEKRKQITGRRKLLTALGLAAGLAILLSLTTVFLYRGGVVDNYIKSQFVSRMSEIGVDFSADVFRVTVAPLKLELRNATFNDRITGDKLFFIRDAQLGLTVQDLFAWQLSRDISIDTTDLSGVEVWVTFDENGRSNFANINLIEEDVGSRVNFKYQSLRFTLREGIVHFNDTSRSIGGTANNVVASLEPVDLSVPDDEKRYRIDLSSTQSRFIYEDSPLEPIDLRAVGIADRSGAEITQLTLTTPIGRSNLTGRITDWASLRYDLNIESSVDLTQATSIFPIGTPVRGIGNFKGTVSGSGDEYKIVGEIDSETLTAEGVYLRGVNVAATVEGTNSNYYAHGTAIAELLTFGEFRIEFPKLAGNVRGTGTDFRWLGELQAIAARSGSLTLGGLFLSDAVAEYKDRQFTASARNGRAQRFAIDDQEFTDLSLRNLRLSMPNGGVDLRSENVAAGAFAKDDIRLSDLQGRDLTVRRKGERTDVTTKNLVAKSANVGGSTLQNVTADELTLTDLPASTEMRASNLRATGLNADGTRIEGIHAPRVSLTDQNGVTRIYSDEVRVARIDAGAAVLGSLNIGGVRLSVREGRIEGRSNDIEGGSVTLARSTSLPEGGTIDDLRISSPVFVVEPSGRYRATADMSIGGGTIGKIPLGTARAQVLVTNEGARINELTAQVMNGSVTGNALIAFTDRTRSAVNADFSGLDLSVIAALQSGRIMPFEGQASGRLDLTLAGTDYTTTSGTINATISAAAGTDAQNKIPVNGNIDISASNGLFTIEQADLRTDNSELTATGRFDLRNDDSDLGFSLRSSDGAEILNLARLTGAFPELEAQLDSMRAEAAGDLSFSGRITGNLTDPTIDGSASIERVLLRGRDLGTLTSDIRVTPLETDLSNGRLRQSDGGVVTFDVKIPAFGSNNISVDAELAGVNAANLLAALPVDLPDRLRDFNGKTSGTVALTGLPSDSRGEINVASESGTIAGQAFDSMTAKAVFDGSRVNIERGEIRIGEGFLTANGSIDSATSLFDLDLEASSVPLPLVLAFLPADSGIPAVTGVVDAKGRATGDFDRPATMNVNFSGSARDVVINARPLGGVTFEGVTENQVLRADLVATLENRPQTINATLNFGDENLPFRVATTFDQSPLGPFFALIPQLSGISIEGVGTGQIEFGGNIAQRNADGTTTYTAAALSGSARFSQLSLRLEETPVAGSEPLVVRFDTREVTFENAKFSGSGSNLTIAGSKALDDNGVNNLSVDGRINLSLLNAIPQLATADTFFSGFADVSMRLSGPNRTSRLTGTANLENASFATFMAANRLTIDRLKGRILFAGNQIQVDQASGYLGGGQFFASGGALLDDDLQISSYRVDLNGTNITVPIPENFITTGDARLEISGRRLGGALSTQIAGNIRARRSIFTRDIDLAQLVGGRREGSLSTGPSSIRAPRFDLVIEGRDALVVRNNIADLTASVSLRLSGTTESPQISGRITANSGTVFFRRDRYEVQRGVLEFPPNTEIEPIISLQAESEIAGYQIFVNLSGPLTDTENLTATVRSSPALPQSDVISLITTGNLSNTESGIPTLAQTGLNTAAEVLTDTIINNPARRATDRLFGLNVFEIDPIISGQRTGPSARLTVGRQINNNLRVTYATNLSQDQNQVLALEYRVSNRLSFVAQYEQRSLTNVTQERNAFSFEVRFRRRF
ncbi:MAG TPA: translocation/assembly module TamB domain-containing protein [Pyrinomonadaceae bacterium]|nr:translocation/assembly module TamB domain-containing protein [Pyrinomonadaceae bacterium]